MIEPKQAVEGLSKLCEAAFQLEKARYPDFLVMAWQDQVRIAERYVGGEAANAYVAGMAAGFAEAAGVSADDWAADTLEKEHAFVAARAHLASVFHRAEAAIMAAPEEALPAVIEGLRPLAVEAGQAVGTTTDADALITRWVNGWADECIAMSMDDGVEEDELT